MLKQTAHGRESKHQRFLITELYFLELPGNWALQIMPFAGGSGRVRIRSGSGLLRIKNVETTNNNVFSGLSQAWGNKATPHNGMLEVLKVPAVVIALFDCVQ